MSMYRQGDRIIFNYPTLLIPNTCATITHVVRDSENGDERDLYVVMVDWNEMRAGQTYTITNTHVVRLQNPPAAVATDPEPAPAPAFISSNSAFRWDVPIPEQNTIDEIINDPSDDDEAHDDEEEEEEADQSEEPTETSWMDRAINGMSISLEEAARQQLNRSLSEDTPNNAGRIQYISPRPSTTRQQFNPQPMPRPEPQIVYNEMRLPTEEEIQQFVVIGGIRPIGMLEVEGVAKPVYDSAAFQAAGILAAHDYTPTLESRYYIMFVIERTAIKPCYDTRHGIIIFKSDRGTIFVNEHSHERTVSVEYYRDVMRVRWARRDYVHRWHERNNIPMPSLYPKKKLRRKYKEIPKIKEEKFYAGNKEYIC